MATRPVGFIAELEIESSLVPKRRGALYGMAARRIQKLERALSGLLVDTQHSEHKCKDKDCPVAFAQRVLKEKAK